MEKEFTIKNGENCFHFFEIIAHMAIPENMDKAVSLPVFSRMVEDETGWDTTFMLQRIYLNGYPFSIRYFNYSLREYLFSMFKKRIMPIGGDPEIIDWIKST